MQGVEIIASEAVYKTPVAAIVLLCILITISIPLFIYSVYEDTSGIPAFIGSVCCVVMAVIVAISIYAAEPKKKYDKLYIVVDETASVTEFYQKYEVLDRCGKLWTVKEIEDEDRDN